MKKHTTFGRDAIAAAEKKLGLSSFLRFAKEIAYTHQEKWAGSGYPQNLEGDQIPISGRLMAVADVYDALISRRCYKPPFTHDVAVDLIREGRGTHFDSDMVDAFLDVSETFRDIAIEYAESDEERAAFGLRHWRGSLRGSSAQLSVRPRVGGCWGYDKQNTPHPVLLPLGEGTV